MPGQPAPSINLAASLSAPREAGSFLVDTLRDRPPEQVALATRLTAEILEMIVRHVTRPIRTNDPSDGRWR